MAEISTDCGFTFGHYSDIVTRLAASHRLTTFRDAERPPAGDGPLAILRHDIDFGLDPAVEMARLEHQMGVVSTYFVRIDAVNYNPFSLPGVRKVRQILDWGHDIGLHYSIAVAEEIGISPAEAVVRQRHALSKLTGHEVVVGAAHEPSRSAIDRSAIFAESDLLVDAYEPRFVSDMKYLSDSAGRWREGCACGWQDKGRDLCILTHPLWWYERTPEERY